MGLIKKNTTVDKAKPDTDKTIMYETNKLCFLSSDLKKGKYFEIALTSPIEENCAYTKETLIIRLIKPNCSEEKKAGKSIMTFRYPRATPK
jgi:hypothetical protein